MFDRKDTQLLGTNFQRLAQEFFVASLCLFLGIVFSKKPSRILLSQKLESHVNEVESNTIFAARSTGKAHHIYIFVVGMFGNFLLSLVESGKSNIVKSNCLLFVRSSRSVVLRHKILHSQRQVKNDTVSKNLNSFHFETLHWITQRAFLKKKKQENLSTTLPLPTLIPLTSQRGKQMLCSQSVWNVNLCCSSKWNWMPSYSSMGTNNPIFEGVQVLKCKSSSSGRNHFCCLRAWKNR